MSTPSAAATTAKPISDITGYHAHIYFDSETEAAAQAIREEIEAQFDVVMGRWHHKLVGPHPRPMYQVAFETKLFPEFTPWLALNRRNLTVLLHPNTGDHLTDHTSFAMWMGEVLELNVGIFDKSA
ncbi:MAG: DOPA 4,5-dioxygenase family protein [Alphaproteobacteria bacterium]|nr:DOPA 4,5-dioxygenase family protein [Alphaproteobacteria bacterium]